MKQDSFVKLSALAFGLILLSFIIRGLSRLVVTVETATLLSTPTMVAGAALVIFLTARSVLAVSGLRPLQ
jgi:hypothetical protein